MEPSKLLYKITPSHSKLLYKITLFAGRNSISRLTEVALLYNRSRKLFLNSSDGSKFQLLPVTLQDLKNQQYLKNQHQVPIF